MPNSKPSPTAPPAGNGPAPTFDDLFSNLFKVKQYPISPDPSPGGDGAGKDK